jgi:hypothetical protein
MADAKLTESLGEGEDLKLSWKADTVRKITESESQQLGNNNSEWTFGATNERIVYKEGSEDIKALDYTELKSLDSDGRNRSPMQKLMLFYGIFLTGLGLYAVFEGNRELGSLGILVGIASLGAGALIERGITDSIIGYLFSKVRGSESGGIYNSAEKHSIRFTSDSDPKQVIEVISEEDVGEDLYEVVPTRLHD